MSSNGVEWTLNEAMTSSTDQPHIKEEAMPSTILYSNEREGLSRDSGNCSVPLVRSATETATWTSSHHHSDLANSLAKAESQDTASSEPSYGDAISSNGVEWTLKQASCTSTDQSDFTKSDDDASTVATTPPEDELEKTNYRRGIFQVVLLLLVVIAGTFVFYTMRQKHTNRESSEKSAIESGTNAAPSPLPTTIAPSETPTTAPSFAPTKYRHKVVTFAALGDIPYSDEEHETLRAQMDAMDATSGVAFVIHVGDIRLAGGREHCHRSEYEDVAETLARSAVPVLIIKGDNDSWDCGNYDEANEFWAETFVGFEQRHWDLPFEVKHNPEIPETFYFVYQDVLFIATDVVGGDPHDDDVLADWEAHLESQIVWALQLIRDYDIHMGHYTGRVIIFGHADPGVSHNAFFEPLQRFMEETNNRIPILYLNGDGHK